MRSSLELLLAFMRAELRKAHVAAQSRAVPLIVTAAALILSGLAAGLIQAFMIMLFRSVVPLVFDSYLLTVLAICVWLFPTGLIMEEERDFMCFMRVGPSTGRRLEFLRVVSIGMPLTVTLAAPAVAANYILGAAAADSALLGLMMATSGLIVILAWESVQNLRAVRRQGLPVWVLNLSVVAGFTLFLSAVGNALAGQAKAPGAAFGPGVVLDRLYVVLRGLPAGIGIGALASALSLFAAASVLRRFSGMRDDAGLGGNFSAKQSIASRFVLACNARAGKRSWPWFAAGVLTLYILRARRMNAILTVLLAYAFWTVFIPGAAPMYAGTGVATTVFTVSALTYASICFRQDSGPGIPVYLHGMKLPQLAFSAVLFSSLLSALIAVVPLCFLLMGGGPAPVDLREAIWVLLASYVCHVSMALVQPHIPLDQPIGTFGAIVTMVRCFLVCGALSLGSLYVSCKIAEAFRTGWLLIGIYAAMALPLTIALRHTLPGRLRYLNHTDGPREYRPTGPMDAPQRANGGGLP